MQEAGHRAARWAGRAAVASPEAGLAH